MATHPKTARADREVIDLIVRRWSPRAFDAGRPVPHDDLLRLFEAARWAPSSFNAQPWRFVVVERAAPEPFAAVAATLTGRNAQWASSAPVLVVVAVKGTLDRDEAVNRHAWYDTGQAVAFLTLQATSMGLSLRQMEGFDTEKTRRACGIPSEFDLVVVIAVGYAGDPATLQHEKHREAEVAPRSRKSTEEFVFWGGWGNRA